MTALLPLLLAMELAAMPSETALQRYEERVHVYTGGDYQNEPFKYRLLSPPLIEPGQTYPVVLFLHGAGERGDDNALQLLYLPDQMAQDEWRAKYPCFLIAPQCRAEQKWVDVPWDALETEMPSAPSHQMQVALGILDLVLEHLPADPRRVYLTGLSMGGYGSWDAAMRYPERFAAVAPICGGGDEHGAAQLIDVPIWAFHGDQDQAVPVERSRRMIEAIRAAGGAPKYTEFPGVGHNSWTPAYTDPAGLLPWMFEQVNDRLGAEAEPPAE